MINNGGFIGTKNGVTMIVEAVVVNDPHKKCLSIRVNGKCTDHWLHPLEPLEAAIERARLKAINEGWQITPLSHL